MQNAKVTACTVSELLRKNQQGGQNHLPPPLPTQIRVNRLYPSFKKMPTRFHLKLFNCFVGIDATSPQIVDNIQYLKFPSSAT